MRRYFCALIIGLFLPAASPAAETLTQKQIVNRLVHLTFAFETASPVDSRPVYLLPPDAKLAGLKLRTDPGPRFQNNLDIDIFFEKVGEYNIGPFVFKDQTGGSISVPPQKILVTDEETIGATEGSKTAAPNDLPPKFYTLRPNQKVYAGIPVYLILEIPMPFRKITVAWPGWEDVYWERIEDAVSKTKGLVEIKYFLLFTKEGDYNLSPIRFRFEKGGREYLFSSSTMNFKVAPLPAQAAPSESIRTGSYAMKVVPHAGTNKDFIHVDVTVSGKGYLPAIPLPAVTIHPPADLFLRSHSVTYISHFPEPQGRADFRFVFTPPSDGLYTVSVKPVKNFDPSTATFRNSSGFSASIRAVLPSNPWDAHRDDEFQKRMQLKNRPDYDLFALIAIILLFTFFALALYLKNRHSSNKKAAPSPDINETDHLYTVQRAVLTYLRHFTREDHTTSSLSRLRNSLDQSVLPDDLAADIINWLEEVSKVRYIDRSAGLQTTRLRDRGLDLLHRLKTEKTRFSVSD